MCNKLLLRIDTAHVNGDICYMLKGRFNPIPGIGAHSEGLLRVNSGCRRKRVHKVQLIIKQKRQKTKPFPFTTSIEVTCKKPFNCPKIDEMTGRPCAFVTKQKLFVIYLGILGQGM